MSPKSYHASLKNAQSQVTIAYSALLSLIKLNWQAWLTEKDGGDLEEDEASSMAFSRSAPFSLMNVMSQALPDEQGDSSHTPCFYMCSETQQRLKADILMLSEECDYRLFVKTCKKLIDIVICFVSFRFCVIECVISPTQLESQTYFSVSVAILEYIMFNSSCNENFQA